MAKFWNWLKDNSRWMLNERGIAWAAIISLLASMLGSKGSGGGRGFDFGGTWRDPKTGGMRKKKDILRNFLDPSKFGGLFGGKGNNKSETEEAFLKLAQEMYERGKMTPEEEAQYSRSFGTGRDLEAISRYQMGMGERPEGYLTGEEQYQRGGPLAQAYYGQTLAGVEDPYAAWESSLGPQLEQAEDYINRRAQQRGLLRSGMPIESMGRAGVELAIKSAQERMKFRGQELNRGAGLSQYGFGLEQQRYGNLSNLYGRQQQFGLGAMSRQAGQATEAGPYQAYPYQAQLGSIYGQQAGGQANWGKIISALGSYFGSKGGVTTT